MYLTELALANFRTYEKLTLGFEPEVTVFAGPNGVGKTNIIEAIHYVATISSHRVSNKTPLIQAGTDRAIIQARIKAGERASAIELEIKEHGSGRARVNRGQVIPSSGARGILRAVLFAPEDLALVKGDPEGRRRFLDELVLQAKPVLAGDYRDYDKVLRQRNAFLKQARQRGAFDSEMLEIYNEQLVRYGVEITLGRLALGAALQQPIENWYQKIAQSQVEIITKLACDHNLTDTTPEALAAEYYEQLEGKRTQELERGLTLVGPQRDDLFFSIGDLPAKGYASHGESWSLALALKLAAFDHLAAIDLNSSFDHSEATSVSYETQQPVLLLDDVFSELDSGRRAALSEAITNKNQVFITTAVLDDIPKGLYSRVITVAKGSANG
ncbi:MAG: DNA replication/repair protein RecF [Cellulomonadaceae bacterium]|jgi:DNA replication and repair protein RecF|nr:DNA replication/repair protein RecF [Cellulomonadaceae bacterium]